MIDLLAVIIGLIIGALLSAPLSKLPDLYGEILPLVVSVICVFASIILFHRLLPQIDRWLETINKLIRSFPIHIPTKHEESRLETVLDTSVLIDKRVVSIATSGFLPQRVLVPKIVLQEIQNIADSKDGDRRDKGRRGLSSLEEIKKIKKGEFEIIKDDFPGEETVDSKLIKISKKRNATLMTTDYNLNKIASVQGVKVLNINDLAQGLRPDLIPGQELELKIIHIGKDKTQGVGYLEDGTMIVVESGSKLLDRKVKVKISRSLQTAAGKMFFARIISD